MAKADLTATRMREVLGYEPETGIFTWKIATSRRVKVGAVAGCRDKDGYIQIRIDGHLHRAHRLAWLYEHGVWPSNDIDHERGDRTDNRIARLRDGSRSFNMQNLRKARSDSRSGLLGVEWHGASGLWHARIKADGRRVSLGYYRDPEEAHAAYLTAKRRLHEGCTI